MLLSLCMYRIHVLIIKPIVLVNPDAKIRLPRPLAFVLGLVDPNVVRPTSRNIAVW